MILVDTCIWIDHLQQTDAVLANLLKQKKVLTHPFVIGELSVGRLPQRDVFLEDLDNLPRTAVASSQEVKTFVDRHRLFGKGLSYVDACLLASTKITPGTSLFTRDKRLLASAIALAIDAKVAH